MTNSNKHNKMTNNLQTLTVYLGSSGRAKSVFKDSARTLGETIGRAGKSLVYGGMDAGLMGILASSAIQSGAHVTGIIPKKIKDSERILPGLSETILVDDLWERKRRMFQRADAVLSLPGGFGTLDESLEVLYWGHLGLHNKPLVLINIENYWAPVIDYLQTLPDFDPRFLIVANDVKDVMTKLENWQAPEKPDSSEHFPHFEDEISRDTDDPIIIDKATVENTYYLICALGLKQLGKHDRHIGILNTDGRFDQLIDWLNIAARETFITEKCLKLYNVAKTQSDLHTLLQSQEKILIDLHKDKWG